MSPPQIPEKTSSEFSRCEERSLLVDHRRSLSPTQKTDGAIKERIDRALRDDDVLRAIESYEMAVHVKNEVVHLSGHIVNTTSWSRIASAIEGVPGIAGLQNNLVLDDKLTREVAGSLGALEETYGCKFFTGASHGVVTLNGIVSDDNVRVLAERQVASHPSVRGVLNNVRVSGHEPELPVPPFLQPTIGANIYFRDGISGVVKQVIIDPNNRRVVAMTVWARFSDQRQELSALNTGRALPPERLVVLSIDLVRYMTKISGFLLINSNESNRYRDFEPDAYRAPDMDWVPPYPYCPADVLFAVEKRQVEYQNLEQVPRSPFVVAWVEPPLSRELLANDSLGG